MAFTMLFLQRERLEINCYVITTASDSVAPTRELTPTETPKENNKSDGTIHSKLYTHIISTNTN